MILSFIGRMIRERDTYWLEVGTAIVTIAFGLYVSLPAFQLQLRADAPEILKRMDDAVGLVIILIGVCHGAVTIAESRLWRMRLALSQMGTWGFLAMNLILQGQSPGMFIAPCHVVLMLVAVLRNAWVREYGTKLMADKRDKRPGRGGADAGRDTDKGIIPKVVNFGDLADRPPKVVYHRPRPTDSGLSQRH